MTEEKETENNNSVTISVAALLQWIPIWLALIGMFLSAANVYANMMTRIATLETRLNLYGEVIADIKSGINKDNTDRIGDRQLAQDREQNTRDKTGNDTDSKIETNTRRTEENTRRE